MEQTDNRKPPKGFYLLPNMLTTLGMFLGFLAMIWASQGRFENACLGVLVAALLDNLDGKVARLTHTASEFGVQYDSLADLVAFGLAPAFILWQWQLTALGRVGVACAFIYAACGALRLARFNVTTATTSKRFFIGLPIPVGGLTIITFVYFAGMFSTARLVAFSYLGALLAVMTGLLMISRIRYFSFKEFDFLRAHPVRTMVIFLFLLGLLFSYPRICSFAYCALYILGGMYYSLRTKGNLPGSLLSSPK